ncbi:MAG: GNAT family N-acetyltransferase [Kineosporiaceae bacterium]
MTTRRSLTAADAGLLADLRNRFERAFAEGVETSVSEAGEQLTLTLDPARDTLALADGGVLVGAAFVGDHDEGDVVVDPGHPAAAEHWAVLLEWLERRPPRVVQVLDRDDAGRTAAAGRGWRHAYTAYDLERDTAGLDAPAWPAGVAATTLDPDRDGPEIHELVYRRSEWAAVPGHHDRPYPEWRRYLDLPTARPGLSVVARADARAVGIATVSVFSDGTGYVAQLAVDRDHRRRGLGRALLLAALGRLTAAGASRLELSVMADNDGALSLYEGVGLAVTRRWLRLSAPGGRPAPAEGRSDPRSATRGVPDGGSRPGRDPEQEHGDGSAVGRGEIGTGRRARPPSERQTPRWPTRPTRGDGQ